MGHLYNDVYLFVFMHRHVCFELEVSFELLRTVLTQVTVVYYDVYTLSAPVL